MRKIAITVAAVTTGMAATAGLAAPASAADVGGCPPAGPGTGWSPYPLEKPGIYAGAVVELNEPRDLNGDGYVCYAIVRTDVKKGIQYVVFIDNSLPSDNQG